MTYDIWVLDHKSGNLFLVAKDFRRTKVKRWLRKWRKVSGLSAFSLPRPVAVRLKLREQLVEL